MNINTLKENNFKFNYRKIVKWVTSIGIYLTFCYFLSILLFDILFPNILAYNFELYKFLITIPTLFCLIQFIEDSIICLLTIIVYRRTRYFPFIIEGIVYLFTGIIMISFVFVMIINPSFSIYLLFAEFILALPYIFLKKPLVWDTAYNRKYNNFQYGTKQDILIRQSSFINQFQDGYTSRPLFLDFSELFNSQRTSEVVERKLLDYAQFLSVNGDLIGYSWKNHKINFYLRTAFMQKIDILNPINLLKKFFQIVNFESVSTITFDLESNEISFKLNKTDYSRLNDITYSQFIERILKQIKISFEKFCEEKFIDSYEEIMPPIPHLNNSMIPNYILAFLTLGYMIGCLTVGMFYFYIETVVYNESLNYSGFYIVGWPFFTFGYFQNVFYVLLGAPDINNFLPYIPLVVFSNLLALLLSCIVFYILFKIYKRKLNEPLKGIKIPIELKTGRKLL